MCYNRDTKESKSNPHSVPKVEHEILEKVQKKDLTNRTTCAIIEAQRKAKAILK